MDVEHTLAGAVQGAVLGQDDGVTGSSEVLQGQQCVVALHDDLPAVKWPAPLHHRKPQPASSHKNGRSTGSAR